jgi:transcriptional antiterminator NusG
MYYFPDEHWYAIRVKYRHEQVTERTLTAKKMSPLNLTFQEKSKRKDRKKILTKFFFPGYMFIKTTLDAAMHVEVLQSIGVVEILRNSQGPIPIAEPQIQNVLKLKSYTGKILTFSEYCCGMRVRIIEGPLAGVIGRIDEMQRDLLKICIDSIPGSVAIQVSQEMLEPLDAKYTLSELLV